MIIAEKNPNKRAPSKGLEAKLQARCSLWFKNTRVAERKRLFAVFNEGKNVGQRMTLGLVPGVSDLLYYPIDCGLWGIEMKHQGTGHNVNHLIDQAKWLIEVPERGFFCDSFDDFQEIINTGYGGIDPVTVLKYCESVKTKTIIWDKDVINNAKSHA